MTYCDFCAGEPATSVHRLYHDHQYGFPLGSDDELFGRLLLEINQAGLSWTTILVKQANFRQAYAGFSVAAVAAFDEADRARLLADAGIIRNRLKVNAAIVNASRVLELQRSHGSFGAWLAEQQRQGLDLEGWLRLMRKNFVFVGGEIVREFLVSSAYLPGAHEPTCPVYPLTREAARRAGLAAPRD